MVVLSPNTIVALQSIGFNVTGKAFASRVLYGSELRVLDTAGPKPEAAKLEAGQLFTTYGLLCEFLREEIERIAPQRVAYHARHELLDEEGIDVEAHTVSFQTSDGMCSVPYDLLIGADGPRSQVRRALVKRDRSMQSQLSFVGPRRYVTVSRLDAAAEWPAADDAVLASPPLEGWRAQPRISTSAKPCSLASPIEVFGHPLHGWGGSKYYKIKLTLYEDPATPSTYTASFEGAPETFTELIDILEVEGPAQLRAAISELFRGRLPSAWVTALTEAVENEPFGHSRGATVVTNRLASPAVTPALAIVGDAAHATSWRLGLGLQAAIGTAATMGSALRGARNLSEALQTFTSSRWKEMNSLAEIDRLSPAFLNEEAKMGPLKIIIMVAITVRVYLNKLWTYLAQRNPPAPSYLRMLDDGQAYSEVHKKILRETTFVTAALFGALFRFLWYCWNLYQSNRYVFM